MLTIREPWLLKRKVSTSTVSTWLAGKELMLQDRRNWRHDAKPIELSKRALWGKGRLIKEFPYLLYARWLQVGTPRNNLAHTFTYFANFEVFDNSLFWKCNTFQSWCNAYACAVWCSRCTLERLSYPYVLIIGRAINSRERICVTSCYLTTKIPSALLVAVVWLQHTRYPRFRRGTFDYGVTTSPNKRGRVGVRNFMRMHVSIPMLPKCICCAVHAQKQHFNLNHKVGARPKKQVQDLGINWIFDWHEIRGARILIDHNLA
jgi:hypothetical protein